MNIIYLRRKRKVLLKEGDGTQSDATLAAMQKNLGSLGFVMGPQLAARVRTLKDDKLSTFYRELVDDLRFLVGVHRGFTPMYPDFPRQVMEMSEAALYLNALLHYFTNRLPVYDKSERPELSELTELRVIELGSRHEFEAIFTQLAGAKTSLSAQDKEDLVWFVSQYREQVRPLLPARIVSKENLAVLGAAVLKAAPVVMEDLSSAFATATDVLRLAVARSNGDVSLAAVTKFGKFSRSERKLCLSLLEKSGNLVEDMKRWKGRWLRLGERLHPGDYSTEFPKAHGAFTALKNGAQTPTFNSQVEHLLEAKDVAGVLALVTSRPGELARKLDHLLRLSQDPAPVLHSFQETAEKVSTPVLLQIHSHFRQRDALASPRVFFPKGDVGKVFGLRNRLPRLPDGVSGEVVKTCESALMARFKELPPLGRCRVDERLKKYVVPMAQRSASKALRTLGRGSRVALSSTRVLRFFVWWKNGKGRTDIDLSAALFDGNNHYVDVLSYYNLKNFGGCHSGDIVDAPQGAAEFIDVDLSKLTAHGVRYVLMILTSYTQQPYCDLPECFAGWMARQEAGSGEIFEARTVVDKIDVGADTRICIPAIFDLEAGEMIWADLALKNRPAFRNNVHTNLSAAGMMLVSLTTLAKPDLHTLFSLHVKARGTFATAGEQADMTFSPDEGVTPFDVDEIRAAYL